MEKYFGLFLVLSCVLMITTGDREVNEGGVYCKARGRSGKISIGFQQNVDSDPNRITIDFDELKERSSDGSEIGKTGREKHSFNSFASQDFTFTNPIDEELQNISVKSFNFEATLVESAKLTVTVYIFKENGTLELGDEETNVTRGNVKFSILLDSWKFCGDGGITCRKGQTNEVGKYIDFVITIKGKGTPKKRNDTDEDGGGRKRRGQKFDLGGNGDVILSNMVQYDGGNWTDMPTGFPRTEQRGSKTSFIFRFEKFSQSVFYDPTIEANQGTGGGGENPSDTGDVLRWSPVTSFLMFVAAFLITKHF